jgi:TPR repeat protein
MRTLFSSVSTTLFAAASLFAVAALAGCGAPPKKVHAPENAPVETGAADGSLPDGECTGAACVSACEKVGRPLDCLASAHAQFEGGEGVVKSAPKAIAALEKSCTGNDTEACMELARMNKDGTEGVKASAAKAVPFFEKACTAKDRNACYELGEIYVGGGDVAEDANNYIKFHTLGCDLGRGQSCDLLAKRAENGTGGKKDHPAAIAFLVKGCSAIDFQAPTCASLKEAVTKKDKLALKAVEAWKKGCESKDAKDEKACEYLTRIK